MPVVSYVGYDKIWFYFGLKFGKALINQQVILFFSIGRVKPYLLCLENILFDGDMRF